MVDGHRGHGCHTRIVVGLAVATADGVAVLRADHGNLDADTLEVAAALARFEPAVLAVVTRNAGNAAAHLPTGSGMVDGHTGRVCEALVVVGHAIATAHRIEELRTRARHLGADAHGVAAALTGGELAELARLVARNAGEATAELGTLDARIRTRRQAVRVVALPLAVPAAAEPGGAERILGRVRDIGRIAARRLALFSFERTSGVPAAVVALPIPVGAARGAFDARRHVQRLAALAHEAVHAARGLAAGIIALPLTVGAAGRALQARRSSGLAGLLPGVAAIVAHGSFGGARRASRAVVALPLAGEATGRSLDAGGIAVLTWLLMRIAALFAGRVAAGGTRRGTRGVVAVPVSGSAASETAGTVLLAG